MSQILTEISGLEKFFLVSAFIGGVLFLVRFILQLFGGDHADTGTDAGNGDIAHADADVSFRLLTLQGLTAFFLMFGLVGFVLLRENKATELIALAGAISAGLGTVWLIGKIFSFTKQLQSSGTIENSSAIGESGTVYLTIPESGTGKIQVSVKGRLREYAAISGGKEEIRTGSPIRVVGINADILVVEKI